MAIVMPCTATAAGKTMEVRLAGPPQGMPRGLLRPGQVLATSRLSDGRLSTEWGPIARNCSNEAADAMQRRELRSAVVAVSVLGFKFAERKLSGQTWDAFGGAPDVAIVAGVGAGAKTLLPKVTDRFQGGGGRETFLELQPETPLPVSALDVDIAANDSMGTGSLALDGQLREDVMSDIPFVLEGQVIGAMRVRSRIVDFK